MTARNIVDGMTMLSQFYVWKYDFFGGCVYCVDDVIYVVPTERRLSDYVVQRLVSLGWRQDEVEPTLGGNPFSAEDYDPKKRWCCNV